MPGLNGHRVSMLGIILISVVSAFAYSGILVPPIDSPGPLFLTGDGTMLWVYAILWLIVGALAAVDFVIGRTTWSVPAFIGILTVWGLSFLGAWIFDGTTRDPWKTASLYLGFAAYALGKHLKISEYERRFAQVNDQLLRGMTEPIRQVDRDE